MQAHQIRLRKTIAKIAFKLRSEVDFGNQQQHLPCPLQHLVHEMHIHFRLAAASHALQQEARVTPRAHDAVHCQLLFGGQSVRIRESMSDDRPSHGKAWGGNMSFARLDPALLQQPFQLRGRCC